MAQATRKIPRYLRPRGGAWDSRVHLLYNLRKAPSLLRSQPSVLENKAKQAKLRAGESLRRGCGMGEKLGWGGEDRRHATP